MLIEMSSFIRHVYFQDFCCIQRHQITILSESVESYSVGKWPDFKKDLQPQVYFHSCLDIFGIRDKNSGVYLD